MSRHIRTERAARLKDKDAELSSQVFARERPGDGRMLASQSAHEHAEAVSDEQITALLARMDEDLPRFFPHLAGKDRHIALTFDSRRSSYPLLGADVYVGESSLPAASLVAKFAPAFEDNNEALTEFENLELMHERLGRDDRLRVPRPLAFYPEMNVLLTERVGGQQFSRLLLASASHTARTPGAHLVEAARLCGRWLREYHRATHTRSVHPFESDFEATVLDKVGQLVAHGFDSNLLPALVHTLAGLRQFGRTVEVPVARKHGDFGLQNVHVGDDWIAVFDLSYKVPAVVYEDVDYFLVTLETVNPYPRYPLFDRSKALLLRAPFLGGYFGDDSGSALDRRIVLEGYYLKNLVFRCSKQRRNMHRRSRMLGWVYDRMYVGGYYPVRIEQQCRHIDRLLRQRAVQSLDRDPDSRVPHDEDQLLG